MIMKLSVHMLGSYNLLKCFSCNINGQIYLLILEAGLDYLKEIREENR